MGALWWMVSKEVFRDMLTLCVAVFLSIIMFAMASCVSMSGTAGLTLDMVSGEVIIFDIGPIGSAVFCLALL